MARRTVSKIVNAVRQLEGGGFIVARPLGGRELRDLDPLLMLDHMGPAEYGPGEAVGAPDHPHRGFETVTYMLEGTMQHKDSAGNEGSLGPGWVQWMTAGSGVIHSEMPSAEMLRNGGRMEGFQLWVNLPARDKFIRPRYQDTPPERIPVATSADGLTTVKVVAGESLGVKASIETRTPIIYLDVTLQPGGELTQRVPASFNAAAYVFRGRGTFGREGVAGRESQMLVFRDGDEIYARADTESCRFLLLGGEPLKEPIVKHGPFVMSTQQQIYEAIRDYQSGRFGEIAGREERYRQTEAARQAQERRSDSGSP